MEQKNNRYLSYFIAVIAAAAAVLLDQYTKLLAVKHLKDQTSIDVIPNVFQLHYLENRGAAFGLFQDQKAFFIIIGILVFFAVFFVYGKLPQNKHYLPLRICLVLIVSGAVGNMIDRVRLGYVVDFFYFELINFPIFNVADIYVTIAAILLIVLILFYYKEEDFEHLFSRKKKQV